MMTQPGDMVSVDGSAKSEAAPPTHPVQCHYRPGQRSRAPTVVTLRAYEVYCKLYREQEALVTGDCRGGFSAGELIAFLYARSFPETEWRERFEEALRGLTV